MLELDSQIGSEDEDEDEDDEEAVDDDKDVDLDDEEEEEEDADDKDDDPFTGCEAIIEEDGDEDSQNDDKSRIQPPGKHVAGRNEKDRHSKKVVKAPARRESAVTNSDNNYAAPEEEHLFPTGAAGSSSKLPSSKGRHSTEDIKEKNMAGGLSNYQSSSKK